ncbi:M23 family metallopeptidase [Corynebacterium nasicanis]|uniref:M23 family metallopeptidase n=1 Tax=Corynebacterium nasicanis TaxID=1448267 RepID=A0ABW1QEA4_9CORY
MNTFSRFALAATLAGTVATSGLATAHAQDFAALSSGAGIAAEAATAATNAVTVARPAAGTFTSGFGPRWGSMHNGIDIANAIGTPIHAVMSGTVIDSGPASGYGNWIRIRHDDGSMSVYGHMSTLNVGVGQRVSAGEQIAGMGNLGFSTGSHLHFEIHPAGAGPVDPVAWFATHGIYF